MSKAKKRKILEAEKGYVIKAYMVDINPFHSGLIRHVLIDCYGIVFVPTWGWSSIQDSYKIIPFPNQIKLPGLGGGGCIYENVDFGDWWEANAWKDDLWAWCYMNRNKRSDFHVCHTTEIEGDTFVFAG